MDKFFKLSDIIVCQKNGVAISTDTESISFHPDFEPSGWEPCTREEFTAAALQAIEKLKAQGIDIGTDWLPKWEPKPGEVVCAWDDACKTMKLGQYEGKSLYDKYPYIVGGQDWQHIAPFTGEIPEPFKSRWEAAVDGPA